MDKHVKLEREQILIFNSSNRYFANIFSYWIISPVTTSTLRYFSLSDFVYSCWLTMTECKMGNFVMTGSCLQPSVCFRNAVMKVMIASTAAYPFAPSFPFNHMEIKLPFKWIDFCTDEKVTWSPGREKSFQYTERRWLCLFGRWDLDDDTDFCRVFICLLRKNFHVCFQYIAHCAFIRFFWNG